MSQYTEILPDGSRKIVHYNPHHDGPVSERLTLARRINWLARKIKRFPTDRRLRQRLSDSSRQLKLLDDSHPRDSFPPRRHLPRPYRQNRRPGKPLDQRMPKGTPLTVETAPDAAVIATAYRSSPAAAPLG